MKTNQKIEDLEYTSCAFCGETRYTLLHHFSPFNVVRCKKCGLVFLNPRIREQAMIENYNSETYFKEYSGDSTSYELQTRTLSKTFRKLIQLLNKKGLLRPGAELLEVGCGPGLFLKECKPYVSFSVGVDLSHYALEKAAQYCDQVYTSVCQIPESTAFDVIVGLNLIEHVYDPVSFIKQLTNKLRRNGVLILGTPYFGSMWYAILGRRWPSFKIPEHVFFFTKKTLLRLIQLEERLSNQQIFTMPHAFPLSVVLEKLGITNSSKFMKIASRIDVWLPQVLLCVSTQRQG